MPKAVTASGLVLKSDSGRKMSPVPYLSTAKGAEDRNATKLSEWLWREALSEAQVLSRHDGSAAIKLVKAIRDPSHMTVPERNMCNFLLFGLECGPLDDNVVGTVKVEPDENDLLIERMEMEFGLKQLQLKVAQTRLAQQRHIDPNTEKMLRKAATDRYGSHYASTVKFCNAETKRLKDEVKAKQEALNDFAQTTLDRYNARESYPLRTKKGRERLKKFLEMQEEMDEEINDKIRHMVKFDSLKD